MPAFSPLSVGFFLPRLRPPEEDFVAVLLFKRARGSSSVFSACVGKASRRWRAGTVDATLIKDTVKYALVLFGVLAASLSIPVQLWELFHENLTPERSYVPRPAGIAVTHKIRVDT